jgi:hypothetical protein
MLGLAVISAMPAHGAGRASPSGQNARAQAIMQGLDSNDLVSPGRARALRDCNDKVGGLPEHTLGAHRSAVYRACMADRGEVE